ncbi:arabinose kinase [Tanacetum coccineum]
MIPSSRTSALIPLVGNITPMTKDHTTNNQTVSSVVHKGKGVSSSALVEVARMQVIAAHGDYYLLEYQFKGTCFALPKGKNSVVGAPCGVMDQMASACGEANKLPAMVCQNGGADYESVRIGAFMGRKMFKSLASDISSQSYSNGNGNNLDDLEEYGIELLHDEASVDYLCNLTPHSYLS